MMKRSSAFLNIIIWLSFLLAALAANGQACPKPFAYSPQEITTTSAHLFWNSVLESFDIELKPEGDTAQYIIVQGSDYVWSGLSPGTAYQFRIRAICTNGVSAWSNARHFTTHLPNPSACQTAFDIQYSTGCVTTNNYYIDVTGIDGQQLGANVLLKEVKLLITHDYLQDLTVWLHAPDGQSCLLTQNLGYEYSNYGNPYEENCGELTIFVDDLCIPKITDFIATANDTTNYVGSFRPIESFGQINSSGANPNGTWRLEICDKHVDNTGTFNFIELVFTDVECTAPVNPTASIMGGDYAEIIWDPLLSGDSVFIEFADYDFVPGNDNQPNGGALTAVSGLLEHVVLTDLAPATMYYVYARTKCSSNYSENVCFSFQTDCANPTLITDFDVLATCAPTCNSNCNISGIWKNLSQDDNEWIVRTGKTPSFSTGPKKDVSGIGNYIYTEATGCSVGAIAGLQSNCLFIGADVAANCALSFQRHMKGSKMGELRLLAFDLAANSWDTIWTQRGNQGKLWEKYYIDLTNYEGKTIQLRFEGMSGGASSDMALDEIILYGNIQDLGQANVFYQDFDQDGFGNATATILSCGNTPPAGYVLNQLDCADNNNQVHPDALEIPCNQIDENCNGLQDDAILPQPLLQPFIILCGNENVTLQMPEPPIGDYYWFVGADSVATGQSVVLEGITNGQTISVIDSSFDDGYTCKSDWAFIEVERVANPYLGPDTTLAFCGEELFSVASINVSDIGGQPVTTSIYSQAPFTPNNEITLDYFIASDYPLVFYEGTTNMGCKDVKMISFSIAQPPEVLISPFADTILLCPNVIEQVEANVIIGVPPFSYQWSNGFTNKVALAQTNAGPGEYHPLSVIVTDEMGCQGKDTIVIHNNSVVTGIEITNLHDVSVCGGSDGGFSVLPQGGVAPYQVSWEGPTSGSDMTTGSIAIQGLTQGAYTLHITDSAPSACVVSFSGILVNAPGLNVEIDSVSSVSCFGLDDGFISLQVNGNNPTYLWSDNASIQNRTNLSPGIYSVTIADANCSLSIAEMIIEEPDKLQGFLADKKNITCFGSEDGSAQINVFGGTEPIQYQWNIPLSATSSMVDDLSKGIYTCSIVDGNGCSLPPISFEIIEPDSLRYETTVHYETCVGKVDGSIRIDMSGGVAPYQYSWNDTLLFGASITHLPSGYYACEINDVQGCAIDAAFYIFDALPLAIDSIAVVEPECVGLADGELIAYASGGQGELEYYWDVENEGALFKDIPKGQYHIRIVDANGCHADSVYTLDAHQNINIEIDSLHPISCQGMNDGYIKLAANNGLSPYSYIWDNEQTSAELMDLAFGYYAVTVTDAMGCLRKIDSIYFEAPDSLQVAYQVEAVHCYGELSGSVYAEINGGTKPYNYQWNTGDSLKSLVGVGVGEYELLVSDAHGCQQSIEASVEQPDSIIINIGHIEMAANCIGFETNGGVEVNVTGGIQPYNYIWNNGDTSANIFNLEAGSYKLVVTDQNNCETAIKPITIAQTDLDFEIETIVSRDVSCFGADDGQIALKGIGATLPFNYNWSNGTTTADQWLYDPFDTIFNLSSGSYSLTITDAKGCIIISDDLAVVEPEPLVLFLDSINHNPCQDGNEQIFTTISGGVAPYHYLWSNLSFEADPDSLNFGSYTVVVVDDNDCIVELPNAIVFEEGDIDVSIKVDTIIHQNCALYGNINISIEGDMLNPNFLWSNGSSNEDASALLPGFYAVHVSDDTGCTISLDSIEVLLLPNEMGLELMELDNASCHGGYDGELQIEVTNGQAPYQYFWSNGASDSLTLTNLAAGVYGLTVSDANNCLAISNAYFIGEPLDLHIEEVYIIDAINNENGQIEVTITGGIAPYIYFWNNIQGANPLQNVGPGTYDLRVEDYNGCTLFVSNLIVDNLTSIYGAKQKPLILYPNPATTTVWIQAQLEQVEKIELSSMLGRKFQPAIQYFAQAIALDISTLPNGIYSLKLTLKNGTSQVGLLKVIQP